MPQYHFLTHAQYKIKYLIKEIVPIVTLLVLIFLSVYYR